MIFTGNQTPYQQRQNKTPDSDSVGALILKSDAQLNTSVADYIALASRMQTTLEIAKNILKMHNTNESPVVATMTAVLEVI